MLIRNETEVEKKPKQCDVNKQVNIRSTIEVPDPGQLTARHVPLRYSSFHNALQARKRNHKYGKCTQDISTEGFDFKIKLFSVGISGECGSVVSQELRSCLLGQKDTYKYQLVENKGELEFNS